MVEKLFPADTFLRVDFEHGSDEFLAHLRDSLDGIGEVNLLFLDYFGEFNDVFSIKWRSKSRNEYLP